MQRKFFGDLTPRGFMRRHWQKKPLLVRAALPQYSNAITRDVLMQLAQREGVESRIVIRSGKRWRVKTGPFTQRDLTRLPRSGWTLLVQGVDQHVRQASRLLSEFAFIPYARLDDVMVSYAAPGGGVGPHFDSYDVFLVQGAGKRRWRIGRQRDRALVADAPLRILKSFEPEREWTVASGDVLYLPPGWAHDGVAMGECITYSIGFRAPDAQELASRFLDFIQDRLALTGEYADPDLSPTREPGRIPQSMLARFAATLEHLRWTRDDVAEFAGSYLSEPKPNVVFARPRRTLDQDTFVRCASAHGVELALATRMLTHGRRVFVNGEARRCGSEASRLFARLAHERRLLPPLRIPREAARLFHEWYRAGYLELRRRDNQNDD